MENILNTLNALLIKNKKKKPVSNSDGTKQGRMEKRDSGEIKYNKTERLSVENKTSIDQKIIEVNKTLSEEEIKIDEENKTNEEFKAFEKSKTFLITFLLQEAKSADNLDKVLLAANQNEEFNQHLEVYYKFINGDTNPELIEEESQLKEDLIVLNEEEIDLNELNDNNISKELVIDNTKTETLKTDTETFDAEAAYRDLITQILTDFVFDKFELLKIKNASTLDVVSKEDRHAFMERVKILVKLCPHACSANGSNLLHIAYFVNDSKLYKSLRDAGVPLDQKNHLGISPYNLIFKKIARNYQKSVPDSSYRFMEKVLDYEIGLNKEKNELIPLFLKETGLDLANFHEANNQINAIILVSALKNKNWPLALKRYSHLSSDTLTFTHNFIKTIFNEIATDIVEERKRMWHFWMLLCIHAEDWREVKLRMPQISLASILDQYSHLIMKTPKGFVTYAEDLMARNKENFTNTLLLYPELLLRLITASDLTEIVENDIMDTEESFLSIALNALNKNAGTDFSEEGIILLAKKHQQSVMEVAIDFNLTAKDWETIIYFYYQNEDNKTLNECIKAMFIDWSHTDEKGVCLWQSVISKEGQLIKILNLMQELGFDLNTSFDALMEIWNTPLSFDDGTRNYMLTNFMLFAHLKIFNSVLAAFDEINIDHQSIENFLAICNKTIYVHEGAPASNLWIIARRKDPQSNVKATFEDAIVPILKWLNKKGIDLNKHFLEINTAWSLHYNRFDGIWMSIISREELGLALKTLNELGVDIKKHFFSIKESFYVKIKSGETNITIVDYFQNKKRTEAVKEIFEKYGVDSKDLEDFDTILNPVNHDYLSDDED